MALIEKGKHKECRDVLNCTFIWYILSYRSGYFTSEVNGSEDVIWLKGAFFVQLVWQKNLLQVARTMLHVTIAMQLVSWKKNCVRLGK